MPRRVNMPGADEIFGPTPSPEQSESSVQSSVQSWDQSSAQSSAPASGRVPHSEKMTVYLTSEELLAVEQTRLQMRGELGRNIDRGRLVRAALAVALDDWNTNGLDSQVGQLLRNVGTK